MADNTNGILEQVRILLKMDTSAYDGDMKVITDKTKTMLKELETLWKNSGTANKDAYTAFMKAVLAEYTRFSKEIVEKDGKTLRSLVNNTTKALTSISRAYNNLGNKIDTHNKKRLDAEQKLLERQQEIERKKAEAQAAALEAKKKKEQEYTEFLRREAQERARIQTNGDGDGGGGNSNGGRNNGYVGPNARGKAGILTAAKNISKYATAGVIVSPYLLVIKAIGSAVTDTMKGIVSLNKELYSLKAVTGASSREMKEMSEMIKNVSKMTGYSSTEVAKFATTISRMGVAAKDIAVVGDAVAKLAKVTGSDLNRAGQVVIQTMNAFNKSFEEVDYYADQMMKTINGAALDLEKYSVIMSYVSSAAYETGASFETVNAVVGTLANAGLKASTIGTSLRNIMGKLTANGEDLLTVIEKLSKETYTYADAIDDVGLRGANALMILKKNYEEIVGMQNAAAVSIVDLDDKMKVMTESVWVRLDKSKAKYQTFIEMLFAGQIKGNEKELNEVLKGLTTGSVGGITGSAKQRAELGLEVETGNVRIKAGETEYANALAQTMLQSVIQEQFRAIGSNMEKMSKQDINDNIEFAAREYFKENPNVLVAIKESPEQTLDEVLASIVKQAEKGIDKNKVNLAVKKATEKFVQYVKSGESAFGENQKAWDEAANLWMQTEINNLAQNAGIPISMVGGLAEEAVGRTGLLVGMDTTDKAKKYAREYRKKIDDIKNKPNVTGAESDLREEYEEKYKMYMDFICANAPEDDPFCKDSKGGRGGKKEISSLTDLYAELNDLSTKREVAIINDMIEVQRNIRQRKLDQIDKFAGTTMYAQKEREINKEYDDAIQKIWQEYFDENATNPLIDFEKMDLELLSAIQDRLPKIFEQRRKEFDAIWAGRKGSTEYKNALNKMLKENSDLERRVKNLVVDVTGTAAKGERQSMTKASSEIKGGKQYGVLKSDILLERAQDAQNIALTALAYATGESESKLKLEGYDIEHQNTASIIKRFSLNKKTREEQRAAWELRKAKASEMKGMYQADIEKNLRQQKETQQVYSSDMMDIEMRKEEVRNAPVNSTLFNQYGGATTREQALDYLSKQEKMITNRATSEQVRLKKEYATTSGYISKAEQAEKETDPTKKSKKEVAEFAMGLGTDVLNAGVDIYKDYQDRLLQATLDRIQAEIDAERNKADEQQTLLDGALELGLISQAEYAAKNKEIEDSYREKEKVAQKKAFDEEKKAEIKQASVDYAMGMAQMAMNTMIAASSKGAAAPIFYAIQMAVNSAIMSTQFGMKVNALKSKEFVPKRYATGGILDGPSHSQGGIPFSIGGKLGFEAEGGEYLINKYSTKKYAQEIEAINSDTFDKQSYNNSDVVNLLKVIAMQGNSPVRAFITSQDLRESESARKMFDSKIKING